MKKTALMLIVVSLLIKVMGFAKELILASYYGASEISDAYLVSLTIPAVIFAIVGVAISTTFIPSYTSVFEKQGSRDAARFTNNVISLFMVITTIVFFVVFAFAEPIVKFFASGFEGDVLQLTVSLTRISVFSLFFIALLNVLTPFLHANGFFFVPSLVGFPYHGIVILSIIGSTWLGVSALAYGEVLATLAQLLVLWPLLRKLRFRYRVSLNLTNPRIKSMFFLALPVMLGTSVDRINVLVDRMIASQIAVGGISALNYANRINMFVYSIFVLSISTAIYPSMAKLVIDEKLSDFKKILNVAVSGVCVLIFPITVGSMIFSEPLIALLYGRGAFDVNALSLTAQALFFYSLGMIGIGLREIFTRAFYALEDTKTPVINASIGMVLNIILNIILSRYLGVGGLALASSISALFIIFLLGINLRLKIGPFGLKELLVTVSKITLASLIMGIFAKLSFDKLALIVSSQLALLLSILLGALLYMLLILLMRIDEIHLLVQSAIRNRSKYRSKRGT